MIYLKFNEHARGRFPNLVEYMCCKRSIDFIPLKAKYYASYIFEFSNNETVYYKDRIGGNYQYTDEEKVVLALKAVLI